MKNLDSVITWTHWYEYMPGVAACKCIIIKESYSLWRKVTGEQYKILCNDGVVMWVSKRFLLDYP